MREKYLRYWWDRGSRINPQQVTKPYYRVLYDKWRRPIIIENYEVDHTLISTNKFTWRWNYRVRGEVYDAQGNMTAYLVYRYGRLGNLVGVEYHKPTGKLVKFFDEF